ncbi:MAG TPA: peptidyl-prolyl cis-trans isomerase [Pelomicrobium sp.]|nr:peptidyl-prolyl cis-trans isomerase [Pelomicrobium sp.]
MKSTAPIVIAAVLAVSAATAQASAAETGKAAPKHAENGVFAVVGDTTLTTADFQTAFAAAVRSKYYHGKPPEGELAVFQRQVADELISRVLVVSEARRRGLKPDRAAIDAAVKGYDERYKGNPRWDANRDKMLAGVVTQLENRSLYQQLEEQVRKAPEPTEAQARAYYDRHKDLFVEPEQVKLSVILLKVDPSSAKEVWQAAEEEGKRLVEKLRTGADFAELARLHSGDPSASKGGDMGYVHRGMLPEPVHKALDELKPGGVAAPVRVLEGVAVFRLDDRKSAQQRTFEDVRERAGDLWQREEAENRWKKLLADLRRATPVKVDESVYLPLPPAETQRKPG